MGIQIFALLCVFLLYGSLPSLRAEKHSLYYIYTGLSKPVNLPGIYQFTAMGLLDDIQIDYYNSKEQRKIPKQLWMKENMHEDYWEKGTQSRKSKEQWFNVNIKILMKRMGHSKSDLHVLQWRTGCEVEQQGNLTSFKGISEFSYDGEDFVSFDIKKGQWVTQVDAARQTKSKWDSESPKNTKDYLEKKCVDWLNRFKEYGNVELRNCSLPDVHVFARKSTKDESKLNLTCMATGFYPKKLDLIIRKDHKSLPENETEFTEIRPNHDGSFQMRKSVEFQEDDEAEYGCFVKHITLKPPLTVKWDGKYPGYPSTKRVMIGNWVVIGLVIVLVLLLILKKKSICVI